MPSRNRSHLAGSLVLAASALACVAQPTVPAWGRAVGEPTTESLIALMSDGGRDEAARRDAASMLAGRLEQPTAALALARALREDTPPGARASAAAALASGSDSPPREVVLAAAEALAALRGDAESKVTRALVGLLSRSPSREAVRGLLDGVLGPGSAAPDELRSAAIEGLAAQTGLSRFGADLDSWREWWSSAQWLPEAEWRAMIAAEQTLEAGRQRARAATAAGGLAAAYRRLYAATGEEARPAILTEMLASPTLEARTTGFELVMVSLLNARPVAPDVADAAAARLTDPVPGVRAQAARVVELLGRPGDAAALLNALEAETSAEPAASMLRAAAKAPSERSIAAAARWLNRPGAAGAAAEEALHAARNAGLAIPEDIAASVRAGLVGRDPAALTPSAMSLLLALGERGRVESLLAGADERAALTAARALSEDENSVDELVRAAQSRELLFGPAVAALVNFRPTAEGFGLMQTLAVPSLDERAAAEIEMARQLSPREAIDAVRLMEEPLRRAGVLSAIVEQQGFLVDAPDAADRVELALWLAQERMNQGEPAGALALLERLPVSWSGPRVVMARLAALVSLNRLEDAWTLTMSSSAEQGPQPLEPWADGWLDGFAACVSQPFAREVSQYIAERFGPVLSGAQRDRLIELTAAAAKMPQMAPIPAAER